MILIVKIKNFIQNIWSEFKRSMAEYLNVVYKLALFALAKSVIGDVDIWKVYWIAGFAMFAIFCYCLKLCVERKRAQLTQSQCVTPRNSQKVWFLTPTNCLEFLFHLFYLRLAFAYYMELHTKNHPTKNNWKMVASAMKIVIDALALLILVISINEIRNTVQQVEDQPVADPPKVVQGDAKNQLPEVVQKDVKNQSYAYAYASRTDVALQIDDVESQSSADANRPEVALQTSYYPPHIILRRLFFCQTLEPEVVQRDVKNQSINANVEESIHRDVDNKYVADANVQQVAVHRDDVDNQSVADPAGVAIQIYDVENQSYADANGPGVALQMENQSYADANGPEVALQMENQSYADANGAEVALQMENQSYADANGAEVALQMDDENYSVADADPLNTDR